MKKLRISADLSLPLDVVTTTIAVLGIRNSGKTNTCVVLTEELFDAGQQVVIIDPTDVWWGLKSSKDGKHEGYPVVVFGGRHGDVPLNASDGATVADFIVEERLPAILSLRHFESIADQRRFVTEFARRIYHRKGEEGRDTPMLLVIDEAHLFVPQRVNAAEAPMVGAVQKLVRQGRSSGIGVAIIDQRPASVNKDVLTQIELLVAHRTTSPQDSRALEDWIEQNDIDNQRAEFLKKLPELDRGVAWCWSPGWLHLFQLITVRERRTFDSSATPKAGEKRITPTTLAHVDLDALKQRMAQAIEKAQADDPKVLKARIAELEHANARGARATAAPSAPPPPPEKIEVPVITQEDLHEIEQLVSTITEGRSDLAQLNLTLEELSEKIEDKISGVDASVKSAITCLDALRERAIFFRNIEPKERERARAAKAAKQKAAPPKKTNGVVHHDREDDALEPEQPRGPSVSNDASTGLKEVDRKILQALAQHKTLTRRQLAILTGYSYTSGAFAQSIADMRAAGYIGGGKGFMEITPAGLKAAGRIEKLPTGKKLFEWWVAHRPKTDADILLALKEANRPLSRQELADAAVKSSTSGAYAQSLADLKKLCLMVKEPKGYTLAPEFAQLR